MSNDRVLTGAAGEHFIAFQLAARGYAVGLTTRGTRTVDLVVANPETGKSISIDTKTMRNAYEKSGTESWYKWRMGVSAYKKPIHKDFYYILVDLKDNPKIMPEVFIVPSIELQSLLEPYPKGANPKKDKITDVWCVICSGDVKKYFDKWDVIEAALSS